MAKFQKGQSGNPKGRPRGIANQAKLRESIAKDLPAIISALADAAKDGDTAAAKLLLDRVLPSLRPVDRPISIPLSSELGGAGRDILAALGEGKLAPGEGSTMLQALATLGKIIETDELAKRIEALETSMAQNK
jgi:hypothetical protein